MINYLDLYNKNNEIKIPKIFHFIWIGPNKLPLEYQKYIKSWIYNHPDWLIRIWTDKDINEKNFSNIEYILKAKKYAQKADIMRYEIIYNYGGVYLDIDFVCYKNIEELLNGEFITCNGDFDCIDKSVISMCFFASTINNEISKKLVDEIKNTTINIKSVNIETGPYYFGKIVNQFNDFIKLEPRLLYPHTYNEFHNNDKNIIENKKKAYGEHLWSNSWNNDKKYELYQKPKYIIYTSNNKDIYDIYIYLKKYYDVYIIINQYDNYELINNDIKNKYNNIEEIIDYIKINKNDIVILNDIYNKFKEYTEKCYLIYNDNYDINNFEKIICYNSLCAKKLKKIYTNKEIYYIPKCINNKDIYHQYLYQLELD